MSACGDVRSVVGGEWHRVLEIDVDGVTSETHASPSGFSSMIENNLVLCNTQLLKDCLLLSPGSTHGYTTFTTLVFVCLLSAVGPSDECAPK